MSGFPMDSWVIKAMQRWPNVPALFGWLGLDRRGRWLIQGQPISHPRIVETMDRNYGADEHGRWYFQNGPQRGYVALEYAPLVLRRVSDGFETHNHWRIERPTLVILDEAGTLSLSTEYGLGEVEGSDLDWMLDRLSIGGVPLNEANIDALLGLPSHSETRAVLTLGGVQIPVVRIDSAELPATFGFSRDPQPLPGERISTRAPD